MTALNLTIFGGERPRIDKQLLQDSDAARVRNTRLTSGTLVPIRYPKLLTSVSTLPAPNTKSVYRLYDDNGEYWLGWTSFVDVARAPVEGDTSFRFAFTSEDFEPRQSNLQMATSGVKYPASWYVLGVHPPVTAPSVSASGGTGTAEDRVYVYTFVTEWGEESKPSPASSIVTGKVDSTWTVSLPDGAPPNTFTVSAASWSAGYVTYTLDSTFGLRVHELITITGANPSGYNISGGRITAINGNDVTVALSADPGAYVSGGTATRDAPHHTANMKKRVYRSVTSATDTNYYFVGEVSAATTSFTDTPSITIGEPLPTASWDMPPANLEGIRVLASGAAVGFAGNTVYISEPLAIYAWPREYAFVTNNKITGLGVIGTSVVVATDGNPFFIDGVSPESMTIDKLKTDWPSTSKRGIVEVGVGVMWPTNEGLAYYSPEGAQIITGDFFTQTEWSEIPYSDFVSAYFDHRYYGAFVDSEGVGHIFSFDTRNGGLVSYVDLYARGLYTDPVMNQLYIIDINGELAEWDADLSLTLPQDWWSKDYVLPKPINLAIGRVDADFNRTPEEQQAYEDAVAAQEALNASYISNGDSFGSLNKAPFGAYSVNGSAIKDASLAGDGALRKVTVNLYADGELYYSTSVSSDREFRLPAGSLYREFSVRVLSILPIRSVHLATSATELG